MAALLGTISGLGQSHINGMYGLAGKGADYGISKALNAQLQNFMIERMMQQYQNQQGLNQQNFGINSSLMNQQYQNQGVLNRNNAELSGGLMKQSNNLDINNYMAKIGRLESAFGQSGLPSWLAQMPGQSQLFPRTSQHISGSNFWDSKIPGNVMNTPYTGTQSQNVLQTGNLGSSLEM